MNCVLTLVSSRPEKPVGESHIRETADILGVSGIRPVWLAENKAADIPLSERPETQALAAIRDFLAGNETDFFIGPAGRRRKKLLLADMDSTIVSGETLDDLAAFAGLKDEIAAITAEAMEGKLDFHEALIKRVELLKGLSEDALHETLAHMTVNPGAEKLVGVMRKHGATCVLVSGGFTFFTGAVEKKTGFHFSHGNVLGMENGKLTGKVLGPILDKNAKVDFLDRYSANLQIKPEDAMTIGDGANDIPMLKAAGLGIGYRPKAAVRREIDSHILYGDLTAALYAQGYTAQDLS